MLSSSGFRQLGWKGMIMRVLLVNPRYPQTFWSFDRVLRMLNKKCVQPPLGLLTVAALLPKDWELRLADATVRDVSEGDWAHGDVVFITGMITQYSGIIDTIRQAKKRGKTVVVGGPMAFHVPDDALLGDEVDEQSIGEVACLSVQCPALTPSGFQSMVGAATPTSLAA
jgi:hypothetical protein